MALDFPNSPVTGATYSAGPGGATWVWDGTKWMPGPQTPSLVTVSVTAPSSPTPGTLWYDLNGGLLYCYVNDGNSSQWVIANPNSAGIMGPAGATGPQGLTGPQGPYAFNYIHNPYFNIQQRGAGSWSATGASPYTADRFQATAINDTYNLSLVALADSDRTAIGDESALTAYQAAFTGSATSGSYSFIIQKVENVRRLSGKQITMSFWARATSGTPRIGVGYSQGFGTGGSPSASVFGTFGSTSALSTTWQRYSLTAVLPSAAGKTFGTTAGTDLTQLEWWCSDQGNYTIRSNGIGVQSGTVQFWGMQCEVGPIATPLAKIEYAQDLANCQRFFQAWNPPPLRGNAPATVATSSRMGMAFPVPMRAVPSLTLISPLPVYNGNMVTTITSINVNECTTTILEIDTVNAAAWGAATQPCEVYTGNGGSLYVSADL